MFDTDLKFVSQIFKSETVEKQDHNNDNSIKLLICRDPSDKPVFFPVFETLHSW